MTTERGTNPVTILLGVAVAAAVLFGIFLLVADRGADTPPATAAGDLQPAPDAGADAPEPVAPTTAGDKASLVNQALRQMTANDPETQCEGAEALGRLRAVEESGQVETLLDRAERPAVKVCAAAALVQLGHTPRAMQVYGDWLRADDDALKMAALRGLGQIGPPAAGVALPYLGDALKSPDRNMRLAATDALTKIGPSGIPLLKVAAQDPDPAISRLAAGALGGTPR